MKSILPKTRYFSVIILAVFTLASCSKSAPPDSSSKLPKEAQSIVFEVHKTPTCGCCSDWVKHLEENGFDTKVSDHRSLNAIKNKLNIHPDLQSCHTGVSPEGFFFEGHIPSKYIAQFLANPPEDTAGLSVPGMPVGSPGMEMGDRFSPYEILLVKQDGSTEVFAKIGTYEEQF